MKDIFQYTGCPTRYRTRYFFNNSNTNEDIATKFEHEYVRCVRNEEECVCSVCLFRCNIFIGVRIIKEMPGSVTNGTPCISNKMQLYTVYLYLETALHVSCVTSTHHQERI